MKKKGECAVEETKNKEHTLTLCGRGKLCVTGVEDVGSFDDDCVTAYTTEGVLTVRGGNFKINRLCVESGELELEGDVDSIEYSNGTRSGGGFFGKIFR